MCGIAGIAGQGVALRYGQSVIKAMTDAMAHRGPDGDGFHVQGNVILGHRRLSIIDLEGGDQPIYNEDRTLAIIFNGEIYNYKELRAELIKKGYRFQTESDTETIVHLYQEYGAKAVERLNGMFAFAIWDERQQQLFIARDRLGEKPLYYSVADQQIAFASELKVLAQCPWFKPTVDVDALSDYLALGYVPAPATIFAGVRKLPPAHTLTFRDGEATVAPYWSLDYGQPRLTTSLDDIVEEFEALLRSAVSIQLRSDVPVASFLSGGIDSTLISALAAQEYAGTLKTFTVGFNEQKFDESADAGRVAEYLGTEHHKFVVTDNQLDMLPALVAHYDEPFADPSMLPTYFVTRAASEQVKVCLSGDAGDELFGGYRRYLPPRSEQWGDALPAPLRRAVMGQLQGRIPMHWQGAGLVDRLAVDGSARYLRGIGVFSEGERLALLEAAHASSVRRDADYFANHWDAARGESFERKMYADLFHYLPEDILVKVDRAAMMNSLEVRVPLLDYRVVEFAARVPNALRIHEGRQKVMLRRLLQRLVPDWVLDKPKQGFGVPIGDWFRGQGAEEFLTTMQSDQARSREFVNPEYVRRLISEHRRGPRDLSTRIWSLLCLELWLEHWRGSVQHRAA